MAHENKDLELPNTSAASAAPSANKRAHAAAASAPQLRKPASKNKASSALRPSARRRKTRRPRDEEDETPREEEDDNVSESESDIAEHAPSDSDSSDSGDSDSGEDEGETGARQRTSVTAAKQAGGYSVYSLGCRWQGCTRQFDSALEAREHEKEDHVLASHGTVCLIAGCGKEYDTHAKLVRHSIAHRERQFTCEDCGKKFVYSWDLKRHQFLHTGERPFQCPIPGCGRSFTKSTNCDAHLANDHKEPDRDARIAMSTGFFKSSSKSKKSKQKKMKKQSRKRDSSSQEEDDSSSSDSEEEAQRSKSHRESTVSAAGSLDDGKGSKRKHRSGDSMEPGGPNTRGQANPISMMGYGGHQGGVPMRQMPFMPHAGAGPLGPQMMPAGMIPGLPMPLLQAPPGYMAQPLIAFVPAASHDSHSMQSTGNPGPPIQFHHPGIMYSYHPGQVMHPGHMPYQYQMENISRSNQPAYHSHTPFTTGHMAQSPQGGVLHPGVVSPPLPSQPRSRQIGNGDSNGALKKDQGPSKSKE